MPRLRGLRRARELRKYFLPNGSYDRPEAEAEAGPASFDAILNCFTQLAALRMGCRRAVISLINAETQFFISESTGTSDLFDSSATEADKLWVGCSAAPISGKPCEHTVQLASVDQTEDLFFKVNDLRVDDRFNTLPSVKEEPFFRFYLGVPITTKRGVNIGTFFVVDDRLDFDIQPKDIRFMTNMADEIMKHLETLQAAKVFRRAVSMIQGLNGFVDGMTKVSHNQGDKVRNVRRRTKPKRGGRKVRHPGKPQLERRGSQQSVDYKDGSYSESDGMSDLEVSPASKTSPPTTESELEDVSELEARSLTFFKAARIIRKSLVADGVVLFDSSIGYAVDHADNDESLTVEVKAQRSFTSASFDIVTPTFEKPSAVAAVLGFALKDEEPLASPRPPDSEGSASKFRLVDESALRYVTMLYGGGKLWKMDDGGSISSSDETVESEAGQNRYDQGSQARLPQRRPEYESKLLNHLFPNARQVLFYPLFDPMTQRPIAGCFAWSDNISQLYTKAVELAFIKTLLNNVSSEVSRLEVIYADEQKTKFISTVSHELRSPLHGILGATEFVKETELDEHQLGLVDTIESSGKALLDTINSILDYSKINSFTRDKRGKQRLEPVNLLQANSQSRSIVNGLAVPVNLAVLCEEISDSALAGFVFSAFSSDVTDSKAAIPAYSRDFQNVLVENVAPSKLSKSKRITMVLNIEAGDWNFVTEPGAIRRILMNLIGNSLKYTSSSGHIAVGLQTTISPGPEVEKGTKTVLLTITDSGKGISNKFLKQSLFMPFSQESALSTGLGLGLSIVRSIVDSMSGQIEIESKLGVGTIVRIRLPLKKFDTATKVQPSPSDSAGSPKSFSEAFDFDQSNQEIHKAGYRAFALFGFESPKDGSESHLKLVKDSIVQIISSWFEGTCHSCESQQKEALAARIIIVNEAKIEAYVQWEKHNFPDGTLPSLIIAYEKTRQMKTQTLSTVAMGRSCTLVSFPIGPMKFSKAVIHAIRSKDKQQSSVLDTIEGLGDKHVKGAIREVVEETGEQVPYFNDNPMDPANDPQSTTPSPLSGRTSDPEIKSQFIELTTVTSRRPSTAGQTSTVPEKPLPTPQAERKTEIPRVLLVDDNQVNLKLIEMFMRKKRYQDITRAENGLEAVEAVQVRSFDIIFMDLSMPVMNGFEATKIIRDAEKQSGQKFEGPPALIIALTGLASDMDRSAAFDAGVDQYLTKPVKFSDVGKIVDKWRRFGYQSSTRRSSTDSFGNRLDFEEQV